jgi:hypothetical protein
MRITGRALVFLWGVSVCSGLAATAHGEAIGKAASVVPSADLARGTVVRTLTIDEALEQDDRIRTSQSGLIQVRFRDDTMLTIGPNSEILLDKFVFDGSTAKSLSIEVVRGAMRFVSGTSNHNAYEIKTPVATIGVRGTVVDTGFVNGHWIHNTISGSITGCARGTSNCKDYNAGDPAFSIGPNGFISINPSETKQLFHNLDQSHVLLARAAGHDPSAPSGAAAGSGGNTGSTGSGNSSGNGGNQGNSGGSSGSGSIGNESGIGNLAGCTSGCAPPPPPPPCTTAECLGVLPPQTGPAFPSLIETFRITGVGGDGVFPQNSVTDTDTNLRQSNYVYAQRSSVIWDNATDLRSITLQGTPNPLDPNTLKVTRNTAQITDVAIGTGNVPGFGNVPVYYMASLTNGSMSFLDSSAGASSGTIPTDQSLQILAWGYTGDLFGTRNSFPGANNIGNTAPYGTVVLFNLENATRPTWNNVSGAPGTFTGNVAVAIGPTTLYYGMAGAAVMPGFGTFNFSTAGGLTDPKQSGAFGPLTGDYQRLQANSFATTVTPGGTGAASFCGTACHAEIDFNVIFFQKIGATYRISNSQFFGDGNPQINGIATFAPAPSASTPSPSPTGIVSFADTIISPAIAATAPASGTVENLADGVALKQANLTSGESRTRGTATVTDIGSVPGIISWERWTNGTYATEANPSISIPQNAGVPFVYGMPLTYVSGFGNPFFTPANFGSIVQYSLIGATTPTIADGSVSTSIANPAFVGSGGPTTSKLGVDFANMKVGFDMYVQIGAGFGQSIYKFSTPGGAANPSSGGIGFDSSGRFATSGRTLPVSLIGSLSPGDGVASCTAAGYCKAGVNGFLSGPDGTYAGLNYYFGNTSSTTLVSGAAVFGRDMPITEAAAYAFAYTGLDPSFSHSTVGSANSQVTGSSNLTDTPSGLALQNFFINIPNSSGPGVNFFRDTAVVKEQGTLGGGFAGTGNSIGGILGWERWTNGTISTCVADPCSNSGNIVSRSLNSNQSLHVITGMPATNLPTTGTYNYAFAGATSPTVASGSVAPGTLQPNSTMSVAFGGANPGVSANLNVAINSENYNVQTTTPMPLNGVRFDSGGFTLPATSGVLCPAPCKGSIGGFLAGPGATGLGIFYQIGNATTPATAISGVAAFKKQ